MSAFLALGQWVPSLDAQTLINLDFGVGSRSAKAGLAATGQGTNDYWNLYRHYDPKYVPGMPLVAHGLLPELKLADGAATAVSVAVTNAPGVWGNTTGDAMYDTYLFSRNGSNITVTIQNLSPGRYHFYLYGHAEPDVTGEQNSVFALSSGTNRFGPLSTVGSAGWKANAPWREGYQYVVFRDVPALAGEPVVIDVAPGANGVPVLNGLQIISRGTSPPELAAGAAVPSPSVYTNLIFREVHYEGTVTDSEARFAVSAQVESMTTNQIAAPLFDGDVAVLAPDIPPPLRIVSADKQSWLCANAPGTYHLKLELVAKINRLEPWNQITLVGPPAAIASVTVQAAGAGMELQLLSGTQVDELSGGRTPSAPAGPARPEATASSSAAVDAAPTAPGDGRAPLTRLHGFLGADRRLSLRWQSKTAEVARRAFVMAETTATAQVTPTVIRYQTQLHYEILQAGLPRLSLALPAAHALTRLQGDQIRDWQLKPAEDHQVLTVEFIKPVEKSYSLTLFSEQTVETTPLTAPLSPPQPLEVERESGLFTLSVDDIQVEIDSAQGLRQVNAPAGALAAYRFFGRPFGLTARLKRIEPVVHVADRITARLEETRLLVSHTLTLNVEKAGIYGLDLLPQSGFAVAEVRGEGLDDWKVTEGKLQISFASRLLGTRQLEVQLEQPWKQFPQQVMVAPLRMTNATKETAQIGAASVPGIRLKTAELTGLREIPVNRLARRTEELLAYTAEQPDWKLALSTERLAARIVADIFNLVTVGDGLVGGSAMIRYGILNQGLQELQISLPAHWKNVEFTGPAIRRKEHQTNVWTIGLQDKAWGGYTLVITYDFPFDPKGATLLMGGVHARNVERETGSLAITTAAGLQLKAKTAADPLRRIDEFELAQTDRALIARPVLLAYRYSGDAYDLAVEVTRFDPLPVLEAVADRTQLTTVLTEAGQMLTQASFMVKNNEKQFQRFQLPPGAEFWSCYVNGKAAKAENDSGGLLVPLPRAANRDLAFAVDLVYAQKIGPLTSTRPQAMKLIAPQTDVPNTYAEWELFVPSTHRLSSFGGNMTVARGAIYGWRDAWKGFVNFYSGVFHRIGLVLVGFGGIAILLVASVIAAKRRGWSGVVTLLVVCSILAILAGMLLPALSTAKAKAQEIKAASSLKNIGLAVRIFATDNEDRLPASYEEMMVELSTDTITIDPESGQQFVYLRGGETLSSLKPDSVLAYSPVDNHGRNVLFADGSVQRYSTAQFAELERRGLTLLASPEEQARERQVAAIREHQLPTAKPMTSPQRPEPLQSPSPEMARRYGLTVDGRAARARGGGGSGAGMAGGVAMNAPATAAPVAPATTAPPSSQAEPSGQASQVQISPATRPQAEAVEGLSELSAFAPAVPMAAGIRPIHIEIPRTGKSLIFTKVLNAGGEPLFVRARVTKMKVILATQMIFQVTAFLVGLALLWRQLRRQPPGSFLTTVALVLILGSVGSLLRAWGLLHYALILAAPLLAVVLLAWLIWRLWPHRGANPTPTDGPGTPPAGGNLGGQPNSGPVPGVSPPLITAMVLLLFNSGATAAEPAPEPAAAVKSTPAAILNSLSAPLPLTKAVTFLSATYTGTVGERMAQFEADIRMLSTTTNQIVKLFGDDVALQQFAATPVNALLLREDGSLSVRLAEQGQATLHLKFVVKLSGDVTQRRLQFDLPPALGSQLALTLSEPDAAVEFPTAVSFKRTSEKTQTRVEAIMGPGERVDLRWTPRVKRAAEIAATVFCQNTTLVTMGGGVINTRATLDYQITQGELRQARVRLPAGQRLLRVQGESIRTWEPKDEGGQTIVLVELLKGLSPAYRLTVETEKLLAALPARVRVETPHALDVKRESGLVALRGSEELNLTIEAKELQRVDAEEFIRVASEKAEGLVGAFRFLKPDFELSARVEAVQPLIEATVRNAAGVGFEQVSLSAQVDYLVKRAGVFSLPLVLPAGYRLERVTGERIVQWIERTEHEARVLEVTLKEKTLGPYTLHLELVQGLKELPKTLPIQGVHPLGTRKLAGFVSVASESGLAVKTESFDGLTEIPATALPASPGAAAANQPAPGQQRSAPPVNPSGSSLLAFKYLAAEPQPVAPWKLAVTTELVQPWVRAEVAHTFTLTETLLSGRAIVRYEIANAPVKEFRLRIPAALTNVELAGINIRRRDQDGEDWRVELQNKVRGIYLLNVTWEQPRRALTNRLEIMGLEARGVERETGSLAIVARPPLQVSEKSAHDLLKVDVREWPEWAGRLDEAVVLAYRYLRPGYQLAVEARRFDEAAVLQALVDNARLTTVIAEDGQMMTEMGLAIRNNGRQYLELELPAGARVWSAFVAGQPVQPNRRADKLLLPLERSGADGAPIAVALTFVGANRFPQRRGPVELASPKLDMPLKNVRWELYLPPDYHYDGFGGSMRPEATGVAATASFAAGYTLADYAQQESRQQVELQAEVKSDLSDAQRKLAVGNVKEAVEKFQQVRSKSKSSLASGASQDLKQLETDLNRVQSSNLILGQQVFSAQNQAKLDESSQRQSPAPSESQTGSFMNYDAAAAEQQWAKLQQAQEVAVAKVQPLRVNLPTRGLHYCFAQVLQTEIRKPLTIRLMAANLKAPAWGRRILFGTTGFLALWILVAVALRRSGERPG